MDKKQFALWIIVLILALVGVQKDPGISPNSGVPALIRWHFLANSDTEADQRVKLEVKDAVMSAATTWFEAAEDMADCRQILAENIGEMQAIAEAKLAELGSEQAVRIYYKPTYYPARPLSNQLYLAAGQYDSVRFVLGAGTGHNWWCLLFPPISPGSEVVFAVPSQQEQQIKSLSGRVIVQSTSKFTEKAGDLQAVAKKKKGNNNDHATIKVAPSFKLWELWSQTEPSALGDIDDTADDDVLKQLTDISVMHANTAQRDSLADGSGVIRPMDAIPR